jgi:hypothetical protein
MGIFFVKPTENILYENGVVRIRGNKITELPFSEINGLEWVDSEKNNALAAGAAGGLIGMIIVNAATGAGSPNAGRTNFVLHPARGKTQSFSKSNVANYGLFAAELEKTYASWLTKGLTKENISQANIHFSKKLKLYGGNFVLDQGARKGERIIPLWEVAGFEPNDRVSCRLTGTSLDKKGRPEKITIINYNLHALHEIKKIINEIKG